MDHIPKKSHHTRALLDALFSPSPAKNRAAELPDVPERQHGNQTSPVSQAAAAVPTTYKKSRARSLPPEIRITVLAHRNAR